MKSPSLPLSQTNVINSPSSKSIEATTTDLSTGLQRKLTFAENEVLETFPSENSGSDFSIDENSQNNTIINVDDSDYLTTSITYETPITTKSENLVAESSKNEEDQKHQRRMKMERGNDDFDDYELQEKLSSSTSRPNDIMKHQQDEQNESASHM